MNRKEYNRLWHQKNKERRLPRLRENTKRQKAKVKEWFREYKAALKCSRCPESHPACLDFHHRNPFDKDNTISTLVERGCAISTIIREIEKCDVLCSNCHRKEHWTRGVTEALPA